MRPTPSLIIFAGLPGVGKTTIARALAAERRALYLRVDTVEQALAASSLRIRPAEDAGYMVGYSLAEENLRLGLDVVADSVNPLRLTRNAWRAVAQRAEATCLEVEVVCSNVREHRRRVETRLPDIENHSLPNWQDVVERDYEDWDRAHLVIDSAEASPREAAALIQSRLVDG